MSIFFKRGDAIVGVASDLNYTQAFDPVSNTTVQVNGLCSSVRLDKYFLEEIFSKGFVNRSAQRIPLDIEISNTNQDTIKIQNMWIYDINGYCHTDNLIILEHVKWEAESISATQFPSNNPTQ